MERSASVLPYEYLSGLGQELLVCWLLLHTSVVSFRLVRETVQTHFILDSMYSLHPLLSGKYHSAISTLVVSVLVAYLSYARSLRSRRIVFTTWLSIATYVAWLGCTIYAHIHGLLEAHSSAAPIWQGIGAFYNNITPIDMLNFCAATTAFAFCSSSTLPLYASLKSTSHPISTSKTPRSRSFRMLSLFSAAIAISLLLPSVIFSAFPNHRVIVSYSTALSPSFPVFMQFRPPTQFRRHRSSLPHPLPRHCQ